MLSLNAGGGARLSDKDPAPLFRSGFGHRENVGFGSLADIGVEISDVRFNPESRHSPVQVGCPLSANSGAWPSFCCLSSGCWAACWAALGRENVIT